MKKIKKLVACLSAAAIAMTFGVSAFAATATYEDGFVKLADAPIDAEHQWTVVVISADKADSTLVAEDLYYINQGTNGEAFWTDGMGTKTELTDGEYIVRIGGETITDPGQLIEIPLTVSSTPVGPIYTLGDVNLDTSIDMGDAAAILNHFLGDALITEEAALLAADVNLDTSIDMGDAAAVLNHFLGDSLIVQSK